jgi:hypothetical protein
MDRPDAMISLEDVQELFDVGEPRRSRPHDLGAHAPVHVHRTCQARPRLWRDPVSAQHPVGERRGRSAWLEPLLCRHGGHERSDGPVPLSLLHRLAHSATQGNGIRAAEQAPMTEGARTELGVTAEDTHDRPCCDRESDVVKRH